MYNFPLNDDFSLQDLMNHIETVYNDQNQAMRMNLSFGLILRNTRTGEYRYFVPYYNENIFKTPLRISNRNDLNNVRDELGRMNIIDYMLKQRENTEWTPFCITNVLVQVYKQAFSLGNSSITLPSYVKRSKTIISLIADPNTRKPYTDNLCFF